MVWKIQNDQCRAVVRWVTGVVESGVAHGEHGLLKRSPQHKAKLIMTNHNDPLVAQP